MYKMHKKCFYKNIQFEMKNQIYSKWRPLDSVFELWDINFQLV